MLASKPSFTDALRRADQTIKEHGVPTAIERQLRNRLNNRTTRSWFPIIAMTTTLAAVVLFFVVRPIESSQQTMVVKGFTLDNVSQDFRYSQSDNGLVIQAGSCDVVSAKLGIQISNSGNISIHNELGGVRLHHGTATFSVKKRMQSQAPAQIWVSHGVIEVLGTEFTVNQGQHGGNVLLHEGTIRFVANNGESKTLAAGSSLSWPLPVATAPIPVAAPVVPLPTLKTPPVQTPQVTTKPISAKPTELTHKESEQEAATAPTIPNVFAKLAKLRSRRQYKNAIKLLRSALRDKRTTSAASELFSYELGTILTNQLHTKSAACAHWTIHNRHYKGGKFATEVQSIQLRIHCRDSHQ